MMDTITVTNALSSQSKNEKDYIIPRNNAPNSPKIHTVHYYGDARLRQKSANEAWTEDEYNRLARLVILHPINTPHRWKVISSGLAQNPSPPGEAAREMKAKEQGELDRRNEKKTSKKNVELEQCYYCHGCGAKNKKPWSHSDPVVGSDPEAEVGEADLCAECGTSNVTRSPEECFMQLPILFLKFKNKVHKLDDNVRFKKRIGTTFAPLSVALGKETSQEERQENGLFGEEYCYGEFDLQVFVDVFAKIKRVFGHLPPNSGGVFWDLGSGLGKLIIGAAVLHQFTQVWGMEKLRGLDRLAADMVKGYLNSDYYSQADPPMRDMQIRCVCADFLTSDAWIENTTVCFIHSSTFSGKMMDVLREKARTMNVGCMMVTVTQGLGDNDLWFVVGEEEVEFSWGKGRIFYHEKIAMP